VFKQLSKTLLASITNTVSLTRSLIRIVILTITSSVNVALSRVTAKTLQTISLSSISFNRFTSLTLNALSNVITILYASRIYFEELLSKIYIYAEDRVRNLLIKKSRSITIDKSK
jgi:hypothetical protein